jgi:hypothetical protein
MAWCSFKESTRITLLLPYANIVAKKKDVPVLNKIPRHKDIFIDLIKQHAVETYWQSEGKAPRILNLGTRRR